MTRSSDSSLKSDEAMAAALSLQRPKRQRNPTTYYTDDKPNTFTTKRYRGQYVYGPSAPNPSYMARDEGAPYSASSDSSTSSSPDTSSKKKKMANGINNKKKTQSRRGSASSNGSSSSMAGTRRGPGRPPASASTSASLSPPKKRGPGRPPKRAKSLENPAVLLLGKVPPKRPGSSIHPNSTANTNTKTPITTSKRQSTSPYRNNKKNPNEAGGQLEEDIDDVEDDDDEERNARRKRGRPPKSRLLDEDDNRSRKPPSSFSSSTTSRKRTSMTSNPPSHRHATRGGGAANLIRPFEKVSPVSSRRSPISSRGKKGATRSNSNFDSGADDDGYNDEFNVESSARSTRMNNSKKSTRGLSSSPTDQKWRSSLSLSTTTSHLADASMSPGRKMLSQSKGKSTKLPSSSGRNSSTSNILDDVEGTFLSHSVTVAPILPPVSIESGSNKNHSIASNYIIMDDNTNSCDVGVDEDLLRSRFPGAFESGVPPSCSKPSSFAHYKNQTSSSSNQTSSSSLPSSENVMDALPSWTPLYNPPIFFEEDYDAESGLLDLKSTLPVVSRRITAVTVRQPQRDYLAIGDSIGFVTVYSLMPGSSTPSVGPRPVARLESVACQQRGRVEQERIREDILRRRKGRNGNSSDVNSLFYSIDSSTNALVSGSASSVQRDTLGPTAAAAVANEANTPTAGGAQQLRSILMNTTDTNIHALAMISNRVVLATQIELECMDVPSGTSLWVCPLSTNRIVTSVDMHLSSYDVLVSCSKSNDSPNDAVSTTLDESSAISSPVSPLMLLQHAKHNVEICDANSPMLVRSPSCTAIWDCGNANRLIFLALSSNRQELDLVLVSGGSIDTWKVACKTKIPTKAPSHSTTSTTKLSQSPCGQYTLVACTRGIRLYQTETLQLIHVYGDQLALHGQSVNWKDCWLAGSYFHEGNNEFRRARLPGGTKSSVWLECNDFVKAEEENSHSPKNSVASTNGALEKNQPAAVPALPPYIIGVPHTKKNGPKELCEKLHVWKVDQAGVVPSMSIPLPSKAEGAIGLVGTCGKSASHDRLVLVTDDGQGHLLLPRVESTFAGTMYPPGYQIVTDNIEYIENEDALDEVPDVETTAGDGSENEEGDDLEMLAADSDDMDEELREAMRQSLLELKRQKLTEAADEQDGFVDVLSTMEGMDGSTFVPCRPEPYLRQAMNSQKDEDDKDNDESTLYKTTKDNGVDGMTSVDQNVVTSAAFMSNVLGIMPNKEKPQETVEEDCLSFTTTKVVMAVNPVLQARPGRGRKGRAGNLDALIKASINPYLQSLMTSMQSVPSNGNGSRSEIPKSSNHTDNSKLDTITEDAQVPDDDNPQGFNGNNTTSAYKEPHGDEERSIPQTSTNDEAEVALGLLGLTPCTSPRPSDESSKVTHSGPGNGSDKNVHAYLNAASLSSFANSIESSVVTAINTPLNGDTIAPPESIATPSDRGSIDGDLETTPAYSGKRKHKACMSCLACRGRQVVHSCGNRSLPIDYDEVAKVERERKLKEEEDKKKARAEKRRLADQRRREAKKQKQRELEQQRIRDAQKEKMEIERQQRLREDFASQDLNRLRRDQIVASYASHLSHIRDSDHAHHHQLGAPTTASANSSAGPLTAKPVVQQHHVPEQLSPASITRPQAGIVFGRPTSAGEAAAAVRQRTSGYALYNGNGAQEIAHSAGSRDVVVHPSTAQSNTIAAATATTIAALPRSPPQSATLASADALVALATFAGASQALATSPSPAPSKSVVDGSLTSYPYGIPRRDDSGGRAWDGTHAVSASTSQHLPHGFSSTAPAPAPTPASVSAPQSHYASTAEVKRSIPSYAAIREQGNGIPAATPSQSFMATQPVTTDSMNSSATNGGHTTVETYIWPSRQDAANDAALAMTALGSMLMGNQPSNGARTRSPSDQSQNQ